MLNNCIESFNKFLFILLSINQLTDKISTWLTQAHGAHFSGLAKFLDFSSISPHFSSIYLIFWFLFVTENLIHFSK